MVAYAFTVYIARHTICAYGRLRARVVGREAAQPRRDGRGRTELEYFQQEEGHLFALHLVPAQQPNFGVSALMPQLRQEGPAVWIPGVRR